MTPADIMAEALAQSRMPDRGACCRCECEQTTETGEDGSYCCCCATWSARMDAALAHLAERASRAEKRAARLRRGVCDAIHEYAVSGHARHARHIVDDLRHAVDEYDAEAAPRG